MNSPKMNSPELIFPKIFGPPELIFQKKMDPLWKFENKAHMEHILKGQPKNIKPFWYFVTWELVRKNFIY